jgi:PiT family inorganic phosphate transporter
MLILIGTVPTAYALNRAVPGPYVAQFHTSSTAAAAVLSRHGGAAPVANPQQSVERYIADKKRANDTLPALAALVSDVDQQIQSRGSLAAIPAAAVKNVRNDMYLASEAVKRISADKTVGLSSDESKVLKDYKTALDSGTRFIPTWVKWRWRSRSASAR